MNEGALRQRRYRARISQDPSRKVDYLQRERKRYQKRKDLGKIKQVADLCPREHHEQKLLWRKRSEEHRARKKANSSVDVNNDVNEPKHKYMSSQ